MKKLVPTQKQWPSVDKNLLEAMWLGLTFTGNNETMAVVRLLRKGLPSPPSTRYISDQLERSMDLPLVSSIVTKFALGYYRTSSSVANPELRERILGHHPLSLCKILLEHFSNREVYYVIAEFLIGETMNHTALLHALCPRIKWTTHVQDITTVTNKFLRPAFFQVFMGCVKPTFDSSFLSKPQPATMTPSAIQQPDITTLAKALGVTIKSIPKVPLSLYCYIRRPMLGQGLSQKKLRQCGFTRWADIALLCGSQRRLSQFVKSLSTNDANILGAFVIGLLHQKICVVSPIPDQSVDCMVVVCQHCLSLCSRYKGDSKSTSVTVRVDLYSKTRYCSGCNSSDLTTINLRHHSICAKDTIIRVCRFCAKATSGFSLVGTSAICLRCNKKLLQSLQPSRCFCRSTHTHLTSFAAYEGSSLVMHSACPKHMGFIPTESEDIRAVALRAEVNL